MGKKPGVGSVIKIMANNADDPWTTPNTDWEKFRFNSENTDYCYLHDIVMWDPTVTSYYPAGSTSADYIMKCEGRYVYMHYARALAYYGYIPIVQHRMFLQPGNAAWYYTVQSIGSGCGYSMARIKPAATGEYNAGNATNLISTYAYNADYKPASFITKFPANVDYSSLGTSPVAGQRAVVIDKDAGIVRVAKPGFDARTATKDQCIIHEQQRPISLLAYGQNTVAGATTVTVPFGNLPANAIVLINGIDSAGRLASISTPRASFFVPSIAFSAKIVDGDLVLSNLNGSGTTPVTLLWYILNEDASGSTAGAGKIVETLSDEIRILRPGAGPAPKPADVLLSSKGKYMPLVAHGTLEAASFSNGSGSQKVYNLTIPDLSNPPTILTAIQKVGSNSAMNDGDLLIDGFYYFVFGGALPLSYYWVYDQPTNKVTFTVVNTNDTSWRLRYYILASPN
ncbi:MAG: hypothetical protein E5V72_00990 [Mesorhizobium sp.]|uniref:hypothetical protein n=1 Tax=Mesorhizobium sp. TaxID=1871066 RepID=UPI000FE89082|nr:hypothetical protein [Mesorhizobium sp.]RWI74791.1 MAG: hypothetical protein EOR19_20115 [Mesorhizobium sp.]RWJ33284.1 MAG: hypothetical protein EOR28_11910 [Mesorhizobium sp.]TIQ68285.1 MAG: hypothetical protein E5X40_30180 [Mesorhizobium sp.]TIW50894.1 MAG: hypothetical protein E5V72_00990 [Mesorhizobium sp.]